MQLENQPVKKRVQKGPDRTFKNAKRVIEGATATLLLTAASCSSGGVTPEDDRTIPEGGGDWTCVPSRTACEERSETLTLKLGGESEEVGDVRISATGLVEAKGQMVVNLLVEDTCNRDLAEVTPEVADDGVSTFTLNAEGHRDSEYSLEVLSRNDEEGILEVGTVEVRFTERCNEVEPDAGVDGGPEAGVDGGPDADMQADGGSDADVQVDGGSDADVIEDGGTTTTCEDVTAAGPVGAILPEGVDVREGNLLFRYVGFEMEEEAAGVFVPIGIMVEVRCMDGAMPFPETLAVSFNDTRREDDPDGRFEVTIQDLGVSAETAAMVVLTVSPTSS